MSNKDLKKINKKINSQIEADSKNDPSFWDDFNKDPDKYKQPTGFKTKAKKYFKRLWPFSKGNSEEQLKREELIRSEARRQYENIRKNRLELDKISTGNESSIEGINDDPLLAKTLRTLNQEQVDVYRETIKTTDFPESGSMDQLEIYTKNFKDTRNRLRNEFDKKFEMTLGGTTIGESDKGLKKNENWLKSSTHGSKTTEDEITKILRRYKDKKTKTPVSMIRTESTTKPKGSQTNESSKEILSEFKEQPITSSEIANIEQSTLKPTDSQTTKILSSDSSQVENPSNLSLINEQQSTPKPANDQGTKILTSDSSIVKKTESTVSDVNEQQSTSKLDESQTTEQYKEKTKKPQTDSVSVYQNKDDEYLKNEAKRKISELRKIHEIELEEYQKKLDFQSNRYKETGSDADLIILQRLQKNKPKFLFDDDDDEIVNMTTPLVRTESQTSEQYEKKAKKPQTDKNTGIESLIDLKDKNKDDELSSESLRKWDNKTITANQESTNFPATTTEKSEPEIKIPIFSELAKKTYEDGLKYPYYDLMDEKKNLINSWEIMKAKYEEWKKGVYRDIAKREYENNQKRFHKKAKELVKKINEAKKQMEKDLNAKQKEISKQIEWFGKNRKKTENDIKNDLLKSKSKLTSFSENEQKNKSGLGRMFKGIFKTKDKKTNESLVVLDPLEYRIEPIITDDEINNLKQAIEQSSEKKEYRMSILKKMLEFQSLAEKDISKTKEAILFRDDYFKPLYQKLLNENLQSDKSKIKPFLTYEDQRYINQKLSVPKKIHRNYRVIIINHIKQWLQTEPYNESDHDFVIEFLKIFKERLSDDPNKPEYPISNFKRKYVPGPNPTISAPQEDFLYFEAIIKPKIFNKPIDYNVWYFKELFATKGKYFYDPTHVRFSTLNTKKNNLFLKNLFTESVRQYEYVKSMSKLTPALAMNIAENTAIPSSNQQQSKYGVQPKSSSSSTQTSNTDSLTKRVQRSVNQAFLQTATQMSEHQFTDYSQQF
ncbi:uncharacterized protein LOC142645587 [Dermatophagoides pteronyssinus]|uniref:uncharacterized protein LOC142645587 n=1 Tax=Dermatophagoides pteronyssinus TaxID=6956 RepID=UPI003F66FF1A